MKYILPLLMLISAVCKGQVMQEPPEPIGNKPTYNFILIYREWGPHSVQSGDVIRLEYIWHTSYVGFNTEKEIIAWMNNGREDWITSSNMRPDKDTRITENQLIGIYDLRTSKQLSVKFKTEHKSLPKRVELQEEKWTETTVEIIHQ